MTMSRTFIAWACVIIFVRKPVRLRLGSFAQLQNRFLSPSVLPSSSLPQTPVIVSPTASMRSMSRWRLAVPLQEMPG
ncbi:hypothetical protein DFH06DRAFT_475042 [Mycena polygramma]|nr:hypothetical protein DFH06DRAFT_475042 [Mycena polygramma]